MTILERSAQLLSRSYEPEVGPAIAAILEEEGVRIETSVEVRRVSGNGRQVRVTVRSGDDERVVEAHRLLLAAGRRPNTDGIGIEHAGVHTGDQGAVVVDRYLRTNVPGIFAAGDVIGRHTDSQMATPVGSRDGVIVAHNAFAEAEPRAVDHRVIPRVIFTDPPVATVGLTEEQAVSAGRAAGATLCPWRSSPGPLWSAIPAASSRWSPTPTPERFSASP